MSLGRAFAVLAAAILSAPTLAQDSPGPGKAPVEIVSPEGEAVLKYSQSHALVIGVSNYKNGWRRLPNVTEDIAAVSEALEDNGFSVETLVDPTGEELRVVLEDFVFEHDDPDARLLIYFAGHGHTLLGGGQKRGYFVTKDAPLFDPNAEDAKLQRRLFKRRAMSVNDIYAFAAETDAKHILLAFDACFAGSVFSTVGRSFSPNPEVRDEFNKRVRYFITSGDETQSVPDYSIFRRAFVTAFGGEGDSNGDSYMTASELGSYIHEVVSNRSRLSAPLDPQYGPAADTQGGDMVFVLNVEEESKEELDFHAAGERFRDCSVCPDMKVVPSGSLQLDVDALSDANALIAIENSLAVAETEVTFEQWDICVKDGGCAGYVPDDMGWGRGDRPVVNVSKADALRYVKWLQSVTNRPYRLPSESEWEYFSLAGGAGAPWSDGSSRCEHANLLDPIEADAAICTDGAHYTTPAGSLKPNAFGLYDTFGNAEEWVEDCWSSGRAGRPADGAARTDGDCGAAAAKGGSWRDHYQVISPATRVRDTYQSRIQFVGFRVVRDVAQ